MKRLLTSLCFLVLATGCDKLSSPISPSNPSQYGADASTATLGGQVSELTADGAVPVAGATVDLLQATDPNKARLNSGARPNDVFVVVSTVTDTEGRYQFAGVSVGTYSIRITKAGFALYNSGDLDVASDIQVNAELALDATGGPFRIRR